MFRGGLSRGCATRRPHPPAQTTTGTPAEHHHLTTVRERAPLTGHLQLRNTHGTPFTSGVASLPRPVPITSYRHRTPLTRVRELLPRHHDCYPVLVRVD